MIYGYTLRMFLFSFLIIFSYTVTAILATLDFMHVESPTWLFDINKLLVFFYLNLQAYQ